MNAALSVAKYKVSYSPRQWPRMSYSGEERRQEVGVLGSSCMLHPPCRRAGAGRQVGSGPHSLARSPQAGRRAQPDWLDVCSRTLCLSLQCLCCRLIRPISPVPWLFPSCPPTRGSGGGRPWKALSLLRNWPSAAGIS